MKKCFHIENIRDIILVIPSLFIFLFCLPFDAYCVNDGCNPSWFPFIFGWLVLLGSFPNFVWIANPFLLFAWKFILNGDRKYAIRSSLACCFFIILFLFVHERGLFSFGGGPTKITSIGPGYYIWLASAVTALISSLFVPKKTIVIKEAEIN